MQGKAHEALGLIFAREGVPPKMIVNNAKEMKHEIRELKKSAARKPTRSGAPCQCRCSVLEYNHTFAPTLHMTSIRKLLTLALSVNFSLRIGLNPRKKESLFLMIPLYLAST
ncbi:hypothetical protein ACHAW6_007886 [Cyclotella cf. meneghiniana]